MTRFMKIVICCGILVFSCACAYRHYLGMHGVSIKAFPEVHQDAVTDDQGCLGCHAPDQADESPATSHPHFIGCLKCHNDSVN